MHMKFKKVDRGFARVYFTNDRKLYCIQEDFKGLYNFYSCTRDGEPEYTTEIEDETFDLIPDDKVETKFEEQVNEFLHGINLS